MNYPQIHVCSAVGAKGYGSSNDPRLFNLNWIKFTFQGLQDSIFVATNVWKHDDPPSQYRTEF